MFKNIKNMTDELFPAYRADILRLCRSTESVFVGRSDDRDDIVIELGRSPNNEHMGRMTLRVRSCFPSQGIVVINIDTDYDRLFELLDSGRDAIVKEMKDFEDAHAFYECYDLPNWDDGQIEDFAYEYWTCCHESEEALYDQLDEYREEIFDCIDNDIYHAIDDVVLDILSKTQRRDGAASCIQKHWREVSSNPYTRVGYRTIVRRFHELEV